MDFDRRALDGPELEETVSSRDLIGYRVVAVHAHPDDEAIATGGALFQLARRGADVTVVTCTLGNHYYSVEH